MKIFGEDLNKNEILKKIGDISQLGGFKSYELTNGMSRGIRAVDINTPCGIYMTVLLDRGMDISNLYYKSIPISWKSGIRETSPYFYESKGLEWNRTFYGGFFNTCGLVTVGPPSVDNGEELGLQGRISNLSAENIRVEEKWEKDTYEMCVQGKVREETFYGDRLQLERKITTWMDIPKIVLEDTVENIGNNISPLMILYHVNIGYPIIDSNSRLLEAKAKIAPRNKVDEKGIDKFSKFSEPTSKFEEGVFIHDIEKDSEGNSNIALVNENFNNGQGIGLWVKFNKINLPYLIQWKQMQAGIFVCGISPTNSSLVRGRKIERQEGHLKFINPGEKIKYMLEFTILESKEEINNFKKKFCI